MTVCIAARAGGVIVAASDRMLTSDDIQFEPTAGSKIYALSNSIFMMTAGDSAIQAEIVGLVISEISERISSDPNRWWLVGEAADVYVKHYNGLKNKRAANAILSPLGLTLDSFVANQSDMDTRLVNDLAKELLNFELPTVEAIFAGIDLIGTHLYEVYGNISNRLDSVGFSSIGSGSRHANSQFMLARHAWNAPLSDTLLLTYRAKRKAEVAPGVGIATDMVMVGPQLGSYLRIGDHVIEKLEAQYQEMTASETEVFEHAKGEIRTFVDELTSQGAAGASVGSQTAPETPDGASSPPNSASEQTG